MCGSIMPAPLAMPPTRKVPAGVVTDTAADFGALSVVMIARAASACAALESAFAASPAPLRSLSRSSWTPMTPVDATSTCSGAHPTMDATKSAELRATARPSGPVHALAQPLLTTTARARPPLRARCSRDTSTGAASALLVVNTPAAAAGASATTSARSRAPVFLMPHATPAARKPAGAVTPPSICSIVTPSGRGILTTGAPARGKARPACRASCRQRRTGRTAGTDRSSSSRRRLSPAARCAARSRTRTARRTAGRA